MIYNLNTTRQRDGDGDRSDDDNDQQGTQVLDLVGYLRPVMSVDLVNQIKLMRKENLVMLLMIERFR